jgi:hypothetical protein
MKEVCETTYTTEQVTCFKSVTKTVSEPCTTMKTVHKKCGEWVTEQYCVPGKTVHHWVKTCGECCFDPCTCKTTQTSGKWERVCEKCPDEMRCKKVWKEHDVCEQVPVTTCVKHCVTEQVPYTVCKKVPHTCVKKVPYTVTKMVKETVVKKVPVTVHRTVTEVVKEQVPYTTSTVCKGAWVDTAGVGHGECAPDRHFVCGASYEKTWTTTVTKMVPETHTKKVAYTTWTTVQEECVKKVPYKVCRMVPTVNKKMVPVTTCQMVQEVVKKPYTTQRMVRGAYVDNAGNAYGCEGPDRKFQEGATYNRMVPYTVTKMVPYTTTVKVPYQVTEMVPCTVCKKVKVCVPEEVCTKRCRLVPVTVSGGCCGETKCCPTPCCPTPCCEPCCKEEGFLSKCLSRLGGSKSCCDSCGSCCDSCGGSPAPKAEPIAPPKGAEPMPQPMQ